MFCRLCLKVIILQSWRWRKVETLRIPLSLILLISCIYIDFFVHCRSYMLKLSHNIFQLVLNIFDISSKLDTMFLQVKIHLLKLFAKKQVILRPVSQEYSFEIVYSIFDNSISIIYLSNFKISLLRSIILQVIQIYNNFLFFINQIIFLF